MVLYMEKINTKVYELAKEKWCDVFKKLNSLAEYWKPNDHRELKHNSNLQTECDGYFGIRTSFKTFFKKIGEK